MDGICGAIFNEEGKECIDAVDQVDDENADGDEEYGEPAAHAGRVPRWS